MQPLNWETAARTPLTDSFSIFAIPDPSRQPPVESFGDHLHRSDSTSTGVSPPDHESTRSDLRLSQQRTSATPAPRPNPPAERSDQPATNDSITEPASQGTAQTANSSPDSDDRERPHENQVTAEHHDNKTSSASRQLTATIDDDQDSDDSTAPFAQKNSKRVGGGLNKSKLANKAKSVGRDQPAAGQGDSANTSESNKADATALEAAEQLDCQSCADSDADELFDGAKPSETQLGVTAPSQLVVSDVVSDVQGTELNDAADDRSNRSSKRGNRGPGIDTTAAIGDSPATAQTPESIAAQQQLADSVTPTDANGKSAKTDASKPLSPINSTSPSSAPTGPQLRFAQHLAAKPGSRVARTSPLTDLEHARLVDRVARAFQTAEARGGTVTLRLHPPELGALRVELRVTDGALTARLEAETPTARSVLLDNVQMLHERLAEQGVRIERFDVDLLDRRAAGDPRNFDQQHGRDQDNRQQSAADSHGNEVREIEGSRSIPLRPGANGKLNVVI